jgi:hypothetical protein
MHRSAGMKDLCEDIKANLDAVMEEWERLVREEPWFSLPREHRINNLPGVVTGLVEAALCDPKNEYSHRIKVMSAAEHGYNRREQGIPESLILTEYHLLRQALWYYLIRKHGPSDHVVRAIMRIDTAISTATNASMWGYYRTEVEAMGRWEESIERLVRNSPILTGDLPLFRND